MSTWSNLMLYIRELPTAKVIIYAVGIFILLKHMITPTKEIKELRKRKKAKEMKELKREMEEEGYKDDEDWERRDIPDIYTSSFWRW